MQPTTKNLKADYIIYKKLILNRDNEGQLNCNKFLMLFGGQK